MPIGKHLAIGLGFALASTAPASLSDALRDAAALPDAGHHQLIIVSPDTLELRIAATRRNYQTRPSHADWIDDNTRLPNSDMPGSSDLSVNSGALAISGVGFKRNVLYAPLGGGEFILSNSLFIQLASPLASGASVTVTNPANDKWPADFDFTATLDPNRLGPAVHVNQVGYEVGALKRAQVGHWLGDLGELDLGAGTAFEIIDANTSAVAHSGTLTHRPDVGYTSTPTPYQEVFQAEFSIFDTPGSYRLRVPGLGASYPFVIATGIDGTLARNDAAGLYHQRSGAAKAAPYTRHTDSAGHTAPAEIPSNTNRSAYAVMWDFIQAGTGGVIAGPGDLLYPYSASGTVDVSGGHHDAGDYGKYTTNSARAIHALTFAIDHFGSASLDNLGIPESGDGIGDLLQIAKIEADFLIKMQDSDGGFYRLVRPRDRSFETDVLPSSGDTQVVYPKNTAATAAGLAALAEIGSSPTFAAAYPSEAAAYLSAANAGWAFLSNAITTHGLTGSYQALGDSEEWGHDDELAWAAAAMYAATGNATYQTQMKSWLPSAKLTQVPTDPTFPDIRSFGFKRAADGWGCAQRAYAFGHVSGRIPLAGYDATYLGIVETELTAAADDIVDWTAYTAYGAALASTFKADGAAAYFFPASEAFDALVGAELIPAKTAYLEAVRDNLNYLGGSNPNDMPFSTGIGWRRQREIVSQFGKNDNATLPPNGQPLGAITTGPPFLSEYQTGSAQNLLSRSLYPNVGSVVFPYYDRWIDSYNVNQEMTLPVLSRSAAVSSALFANTPLATQSWTSATATISGVPAQTDIGTTYTASLASTLTGGLTTWDATSVEPAHGDIFALVPERPGLNHIAADRILPDGRRASASTTFNATLAVPNPIESFAGDPVTDFDVIAWYQLDGDYTDSKNLQSTATPFGGSESFDSTSFTWATRPGGQALRLEGSGDGASVTIPQFFVDPNKATAISIEAMIMLDAPPEQNEALLQLVKPNTSAEIILGNLEGFGLFAYGGPVSLMDNDDLATLYTPNVWHHFKLEVSTDPFAGHRVWIDGELVEENINPQFSFWDLNIDAELVFGNFTGWIDEVIVRSVGTVGPPQITLAGADTMRVRIGETFNDPGASAIDFLGNSLSITTTGSVDTSVPGTYLITYSATDGSGITSEATLSVIVDVAPQPGERIAAYRFEGHLADNLSRQPCIEIAGGASVSAGSLEIGGQSGTATVSIAAGELYDATESFGFAFEFQIRVDGFAAGDSDLFTFSNGTDTIRLRKLVADSGASLDGIASATELGLVSGETHQLRVALTDDGYSVSVDGLQVATAAAPAGGLGAWASNSITLSIGGFSGAIDDLVLTNVHPAVFGTTLATLPDKTYTGLGDKQIIFVPEADVYLAGVSSGLAIEGEITIMSLPGFGVDESKLLSFEQNFAATFFFGRSAWSNELSTYAAFLGEIISPPTITPYLPAGQTKRVVLRLDTEGYQLWVGKKLVAVVDDREALARTENNNDGEFQVGNFEGTIMNPRVVRLELPPDEPFGSWAFTEISERSERGKSTDADGDGSTNLEEYLFGSAPGDAAAAPSIRLLELPSGTTLEWDVSKVGYTITDSWVESSTDLENWTPVAGGATVHIDNGSSLTLRQTVSGSGRTFYRISVEL